MSTKRILNKKVLPGQPLDGTGKICIHLLVPDENGPFVQKHMLYLEEGKDENGQRTRQLINKPTRCRLACDPKRNAKPQTKNSITTITMHTDDTRAVTCPKCLASGDYSRLEALLKTPIKNKTETPAVAGK